MTRNKKVKNPCQICLKTVKAKNGLQCQGACQSWVHYSCLNYTPGKIQDIKAGIIMVTCACPNCDTSQPKEFRTDEAFSCSNVKCPANNPQKCANTSCPSNSEVDKMNQNSVSFTLDKCGASCKQYRTPSFGSPTGSQNLSQSSSNEYFSPDKCFSSCESEPGDLGNKSCPRQESQKNISSTIEQMCDTVGVLTKQINELVHQMAQERSGSRESQKKKGVVCPKPCHCPGNSKRKKK